MIWLLGRFLRGRNIRRAQSDHSLSILATYIKLGNKPNTLGGGIPANLTAPHKWTNVRSPASSAAILQGAIEGHVLVKNTNNALPLGGNPKLISLFGYDATAPRSNNVADANWNLGKHMRSQQALHTKN